MADNNPLNPADTRLLSLFSQAGIPTTYFGFHGGEGAGPMPQGYSTSFTGDPKGPVGSSYGMNLLGPGGNQVATQQFTVQPETSVWDDISSTILPAAGLAAGAAFLPELLGGAGAASGATNAALAESAAGTAGYGASSAGLGGSTAAFDSALEGAAEAAPTGTATLYPETGAQAQLEGINAATPYPETGAQAQLAGINAATPYPETGAQAQLAGINAATPVGKIPPGMIDKALASIKGNAPLLNTAMTGASWLKQALSPGIGGKISNIAAPVSAVSTDLLNKYKTGQISGAEQFKIQDWSQKQKAAVDQYYAKAGLTDSSMHLQAQQQIDQQAQAMYQQALDSMLTGGVQAAGLANPELIQGQLEQLKQDKQTSDAMQQFLKTLGQFNTPSQSQTGSATTPAPDPTPQP